MPYLMYSRKVGTGSALSYIQTIDADSPVVHWRLDETSGSTFVDRKTVADGTYNGGGSLTYNQPGLITDGTSIEFNNTAAMNIIQPSYLNGAPGVTVETWFKFHNGTPSGGATFHINYFTGASATNWGMANATQMRFGGRSIDGDTFQFLTFNFTPVANTTYHFVGVLDFANDQVECFIDGVSQGTQPATFGSNTYVHTGNANQSFFGSNGADDITLDEIAIYPSALSAARVLAHYNAK